jgi:hypothetical protein
MARTWKNSVVPRSNNGWAGAAQHSHGSFQSLENRTEFEYGLADNLQGSLYLNYDWSRELDHLGAVDRDKFAGVSGELICCILNDERDPIGLPFYIEPSWAPKSARRKPKSCSKRIFSSKRYVWTSISTLRTYGTATTALGKKAAHTS